VPYEKAKVLKTVDFYFEPLTAVGEALEGGQVL